MTQRTYYEPDGSAWEWWTNPAKPRPVSRWDIHIRHGFTLTDIHAATGMALARNVGVHAFSRADRYDIAWSAIVTALYEAPEDAPPTLSDLASAGWYGISEARITEMRHHGVDHTRHVGETRPMFVRYWFRLPSDPMEERAVERMAVHQIWPTLTTGEQEALSAFALHGSVPAAAAALGKTPAAVHRLVRAGRMRFQRVWFEHETPPPRRGRDRRRADSGDVEGEAGYRAARRSMRRRAVAA